MPTIGQIYYRVIDAGNPDQINNNVRITTDNFTSKAVAGGKEGQLEGGIYENVIEKAGQGNWGKLGIQAPPGTQMMIEDKVILVGRTGTYELDEDNITISKLWFVQPVNYIKDEDASTKAMNEGADDIKAAQTALNNIIKIPTTNEQGETVYPEYTDAELDSLATETAKLEAAIAQYQSGHRGIYKVDGYTDLENVIIDYVTSE